MKNKFCIKYDYHLLETIRHKHVIYLHISLYLVIKSYQDLCTNVHYNVYITQILQISTFEYCRVISSMKIHQSRTKNQMTYYQTVLLLVLSQIHHSEKLTQSGPLWWKFFYLQVFNYTYIYIFVLVCAKVLNIFEELAYMYMYLYIYAHSYIV